MRPALIAVVLASSVSGFAQEVAGREVGASAPAPVASASKPIGESWAARLRYGIAYRQGTQADTGPGLSYSGVTPNDLAFLGWAWLGYAGLHVQAQREGFALFDDQKTSVTNGGLLRLAAQVGGRLPLGPLRIEPYVGYGFHQLPTFRGADGTGTTLAPAFAVATRHGLLLAMRLLLEVGPVAIEARGEVPIALATSVPAAERASSNGFSVGGGVRVQIANAGKLHFGALLDASYVADSVGGTDVGGGFVASKQRIIRGGLALDVQWRDVVVTSKLGGVIVRVLDVQSGAAVPGADVTLSVAGEERPVTPDANGGLAVRNLPEGPYTLRVSADGYLPFETAGAIVAGADTAVELRLQKEAPKAGGLQITVKEAESGKPVAGAMVALAGGASAKADASGGVTFEGLKPGPVALSLSASGYRASEEAASVVAGKTTQVAVTLVPEKKRLPATITGLVRSTKGGAPVAADLEIVQAKLKTKADAKGAFSLRLEGGTYTVKISAPGYLTQTKDVTVRDGDQAIFNVDLYPK